MRLESMFVGMKVRHPEYGPGTVKSVSEHFADIRFDAGLRTLSPEQCDLQPAEPLAEITALAVPLTTLIRETVSAMIKDLGLEQDDSIVEQLSARWQTGLMVLRPGDPSLQAKEVPLQVFFHKIVILFQRKTYRDTGKCPSVGGTVKQKFNLYLTIYECGGVWRFNLEYGY